MVELLVACVAALALAGLIGFEFARERRAGPRVPRIVPLRQPELESDIRSAFDGPREKYGEVFLSYTIWKRDHETRMELFAGDPFAQLNEFTRCLIVRHLWRALEQLSAGSVVVVDSPPQTWSRIINDTFRDHGIDPWRRVPAVATATPIVTGKTFVRGPAMRND
jgi:hypothetical protein